MVWLIVIGALLIAFGPILYLRPSPKDKRLMELRAAARQHDLIVDIGHLDKLNPSAEERVNSAGKARHPRLEMARYRHSFSRALRHITPMLIQRDPGGKRPFVGFKFTGDAFQDPAIYDALSEVLGALPADAEAVEVDARFVSCYWRERGSDQSARLAALAALATLLASVAEELVVIDKSMDSPDDEDTSVHDESDDGSDDDTDDHSGDEGDDRGDKPTG